MVGDRASALQVRNVKDSKYYRVANFFVDSSKLEVLNTTVNWPGKTTVIPLGRPACGFNSEFCPPPKSTGTYFCDMFFGTVA